MCLQVNSYVEHKCAKRCCKVVFAHWVWCYVARAATRQDFTSSTILSESLTMPKGSSKQDLHIGHVVTQEEVKCYRTSRHPWPRTRVWFCLEVLLSKFCTSSMLLRSKRCCKGVFHVTCNLEWGLDHFERCCKSEFALIHVITQWEMLQG